MNDKKNFEQESKKLLKPKFMTKEEREQFALEKRQNQFNLLKEKKEKALLERIQKPGSQTTQKQSKNNHSDVLNTEDLKQKELEHIRRNYLGTEKHRRKIRKYSEKKFEFDWDENDDTSNDYNPLYAKKHQAQLFGRGYYAGIDELDQQKQREKTYNKFLSKDEKRPDASLPKNTLSKIKESMHWQKKSLDEMNQRDWRIFREDFNITTKGGNIPNPIRYWKEAKEIPKEIINIIYKVKYDEPTPIQRQAIPIGLTNRDIIGVAETGSGKTASFVIPMLVYIKKMPLLNQDTISDGPYALILAPTRELAQQIEQETKKFATPLSINCVSLVGGHKIGEQAFNMRNGAEIIIATPGRLRDCLESRVIVLNQCKYLVMDEADRMIDMGFEEDVTFILDSLPEKINHPNNNSLGQRVTKSRQTTMFSATMPPAIERIARKYMENPAVVNIGVQGQAVDSVKQIVEMINDEKKKKSRLEEILESHKYKPPVIVFVNYKKSCDLLAKNIKRIGFKCVTLHGGKSQEQREVALSQLKSGTSDILIATDVAGRGIDIKDVSLVINYDMAKTIQDYTHRIGRTGRAGKSGCAITFLTPNDTEVLYDLRQMLKKSPISKVPDELDRLEAARRKPNFNSQQTSQQTDQ